MYNDKNNRGYGGQRDNRPSAPTRDNFTEPFFRNGKLNPNWVGDKARELAEDLAKTSPNMGATAMRNFYNEFLRIRAIPNTKKDEKIIFIRLLKAKTNYKHKVQQTKTINQLFASFMNRLLDEVKDDMAMFDQACYVFEAIIGYADKK